MLPDVGRPLRKPLQMRTKPFEYSFEPKAQAPKIKPQRRKINSPGGFPDWPCPLGVRLLGASRAMHFLRCLAAVLQKNFTLKPGPQSSARQSSGRPLRIDASAPRNLASSSSLATEVVQELRAAM